MYGSKTENTGFSSLVTSANRELVESVQRIPVAWLLAVLSIKHRYERSLLGPFWITFSQAVYIVVIAFGSEKRGHFTVFRKMETATKTFRSFPVCWVIPGLSSLPSPKTSFRSVISLTVPFVPIQTACACDSVLE